MPRPKHPVVAAIESEVELMLGDYGYELVAIRFGGTKRNPVLTILMDKEGGVTADDCAEMSPRLSLLLDVIDPIRTSYQLVVSSPGIERPLTKPAHFERFRGQQVAVRFQPPEGRRRTVQGTVEQTTPDAVYVAANGQTWEINYEGIEEAHLVCDWDLYLETQ